MLSNRYASLPALQQASSLDLPRQSSPPSRKTTPAPRHHNLAQSTPDATPLAQAAASASAPPAHVHPDAIHDLAEPRRFTGAGYYAVTPNIAWLTFLAVAPTSSLAAAFYYVLFHYLDHIGDGFLYSTIPANVPLFIGTITSTLMSLLSSVVMMLFAYRLAQLWINLEKQARFAELPTADQFALMMKMCSGGSLYVVFEYLLFASPFEVTASGMGLQRKLVRERPRPILKWTIGVFCTTVLLTSAIQVADVWVHKALDSTTLMSTKTLDIPMFAYSRTLRAACFDPDSTSRSVSFNGFVDNSCVFGSDGYLFDPIETFATTTNTSTLNVVASQGPIAYLRPLTTSPNISFVAQTIGASTSCEVITDACPRQVVSSGYARFSCPASFNNFSGLLFSNQIFETSLLNGTQVTNPFPLGGAGCFKAYAPTFANLSESDFVDVANFNTGIYVGLPQSCAVLACEVSIYNLNFSSMPSGNSAPAVVQILTDSLSLANQSTTHALHGAIAQSYGADQISLGVTAAAVQANSSSDFANYVALTISQTIIGQSAGVFEPTLSLEEMETLSVIGTKVRLAPIFFFLALQFLFAAFCIVIALVSTFGVDKSRSQPPLGNISQMPYQAGAHAVNTARQALIDVTTLVREHFAAEPVFPPMEIPAAMGQEQQRLRSLEYIPPMPAIQSLSAIELSQRTRLGQVGYGYATSMRSRVASAEQLPPDGAAQSEKEKQDFVMATPGLGLRDDTKL